MRMVDFQKLVDAAIEAQCGLTSGDLPDCRFGDYWDEGMSPEECEEAARECALDLLEEEGF